MIKNPNQTEAPFIVNRGSDFISPSVKADLFIRGSGNSPSSEMADICVDKLNLSLSPLWVGFSIFFPPKMEGLGKMLRKWRTLLKNMSALMLLLIISLVREIWLTESKEKINILQNPYEFIIWTICWEKGYLHIHTCIPSIHRNGESLSTGGEWIPFLANIFLQWKYNKTAAGNFGVTPLLVATMLLRNSLQDGLHTLQHFKTSIH